MTLGDSSIVKRSSVVDPVSSGSLYSVLVPTSSSHPYRHPLPPSVDGVLFVVITVVFIRYGPY